MSGYYGGGFEEWVRDSIFHTVPELYVRRVTQLLLPWRQSIEDACDDYDSETQSWREYRNSLWSRIPDNIRAEVDEILEGKSKWCTLPAEVPMTPYARTPQIATLDISGRTIRIAVCAGDTPHAVACAIEAQLTANGLPV